MTDTLPNLRTESNTPDEFYHGPLAGTHFEYRILFDTLVVLTTSDADAYDSLKDRFPADLGYIHEARESTAWLPEPEVGTSLVPKRNLIWKMLEQTATRYEQRAEEQGQLAQGNLRSHAGGEAEAYEQTGKDIRNLISQWRDNY